MGYYTRYQVTDLDGHDLSDDLHACLEEAVRRPYPALYFRGEDTCKWYDYQDDLKFYSLLPKNKGKVIACHGKGEETGDVWDLYVKDGKAQRCEAEIVIPPYDESKLV
jgi:hypothetical protein